MKNAIIFFTLLFYFSPAIISQVEYDRSKFDNTKKMQRGLVTVNPEPANKFDVSKVMISECYGEFNVSEKFLETDFGNHSYLQKYILPELKNYVNKIEVGEDYFALLTEFIYQRIERVFTDNGWDVVDKSTLLKHPIYVKNNFVKTESKDFSGEIDAEPEQVFYRSSYEMKKLPEINFNLKEPEVAGVLAAIADDLKCQANIRIHYSITINNDGVLTLNSFTIKMDTWLSGYKKGNDMVYKWKFPNADFFVLDKPITGTLNYNSSNPQEINKELSHMLSKIAEMYSYQLADGI